MGSFDISATIAAQEQTAMSCGCVDSKPSQPCQLCQHCLTTNGTASLTERIGGVRNELAHKDLLVGVPAAQRSVSKPTGAPLLLQQYRCARVVLCGGMLWMDGCARMWHRRRQLEGASTRACHTRALLTFAVCSGRCRLQWQQATDSCTVSLRRSAAAVTSRPAVPTGLRHSQPVGLDCAQKGTPDGAADRSNIHTAVISVGRVSLRP
jgi:hypothetical protein